MFRVVLDTNVFISALIRPSGPPGEVLRASWVSQRFEIVVSPAILGEINRAIRYPKVRKHIAATDAELDSWLAALDLLAVPVPGTTRIAAVSADPDDDKFLVAAVEGLAGFIVTGDDHLLSLGEFEGISILDPARFLLELPRA